jgi:hypothetical protein
LGNGEPNAISNAIGYATFFSGSHDPVVIHVYDERTGRCLPTSTLFDDICSMEQQTDCKKPSNYSRPDFAHFAKKVLLMRTIFPIAGGLSVLLIALGAQSSNPSAPTQRVPQIENSHVKVWKSTITPNALLPLHRHDHGRVIVALQGGTMKIVDKSGTSETHVWETDNAYWLPKNPPNTMRSDVNAGDRPISACSAKRPALQVASKCNGV